MRPSSARDGRGRDQHATIGASWRRTSSTSSSCTSPWRSNPDQVAAGERVGGESPRPAALHGDAGAHRVSRALPADASRSSSGPRSSRRPARSSTRRTCRCRSGGLHAAMVKSSRPHARFSLHQEGRRRWRRSRNCCAQQYPDFQALITVGRHPDGREQPDRPGRGRPGLQRRRRHLGGRPDRAGGRGDDRHGPRGGGVHRAGVHRLRRPARRR